MRFAVVATFLFAAAALAGCSSNPTVLPSSTSSTTTTATTTAAAPQFSVPAPVLQPGYSWLHSIDVTGKATAGPYSFPIDAKLTAGAAILASGYLSGTDPAFVGVDLAGEAGTGDIGDLYPIGARLVNAASLSAMDLGQLAFLRTCQSDPTSCPTDLSAFADPEHPDEPAASMGSVQFPLEPGAFWVSKELPQGYSGSLRTQVRSLDHMTVLGKDVQTVHMNETGRFNLDRDINGTRTTGTLTLDGTLDYSADFMAVVKQRIHEVLRLDLLRGGDRIHLDIEETLVMELTAADLGSKSSLDAVELYDAFGLGGRLLSVNATPAGSGAVAVTIAAQETPTADVTWTLLDPTGKTVQNGTKLDFEVHLGGGIYTLHTEAKHKGIVLVQSDTNLTAEGLVEGATPIEVKKTVTCDIFVLNLPGASQGVCPDVDITVGDGYATLHVTSLANSSAASGVTGTLQLIDPSGAVAATASTTATGDVTFTGPLAPGTWKARFLPQVGIQMTVFFDLTATP